MSSFISCADCEHHICNGGCFNETVCSSFCAKNNSSSPCYKSAKSCKYFKKYKYPKHIIELFI